MNGLLNQISNFNISQTTNSVSINSKNINKSYN